jgi:hypothetical protein
VKGLPLPTLSSRSLLRERGSILRAPSSISQSPR